jgi:hypothetical protein
MRPASPKIDSVAKRHSKGVDVRKIGADHQRRSAQRRPLLQSGLAQRGADEGVTDIVHRQKLSVVCRGDVGDENALRLAPKRLSPVIAAASQGFYAAPSSGLYVIARRWLISHQED